MRCFFGVRGAYLAAGSLFCTTSFPYIYGWSFTPITPIYLIHDSSGDELMFAALRTVTLWPRGMAELSLTDVVGKRPARTRSTGFSLWRREYFAERRWETGWMDRPWGIPWKSGGRARQVQQKAEEAVTGSHQPRTLQGKDEDERKGDRAFLWIPLSVVLADARVPGGPWSVCEAEQVFPRQSRAWIRSRRLGSFRLPDLTYLHVPTMDGHPHDGPRRSGQQGQPASQTTARSFPHCPGREAFG